MSDRVAFTCNGNTVDIDAAPGETLLSVLRERLRLLSVKDGCAPQGQCGCCTVLVDGQPRVACVTPAVRVAGREVTTIEGVPAAVRDPLVAAFLAAGGSQCGFCTPGILMRFSGDRQRDVDRALAAHLCRCTGWLTIREAIERARAGAGGAPAPARDLPAASRRATLEGGTPQSVQPEVPLGGAPFADDTAPVGALVAVPLPRGSAAPSVEAAGLRWVVGDTLFEARAAAGKVQGRRTTVSDAPPLLDHLAPLPAGGVRLATSWVEPAYLEPDASWCLPGGEPASPLANGGAFGGKATSRVPRAARELAERYGRAVRVVYSREDVVRLGPKRAPIAATAVVRDGVVTIDGVVVRGASPRVWPVPEGVDVRATWREVDVVGPLVTNDARASGLAEQAVLVAGALDRDVDVVTPSGARASATVGMRDGLVDRIGVRVAAGDPLDETVLRSYAIGAAHMALGWVCTESLAVDPDTGAVHDLTIRSFGVIRAKDVPPVDVEIVADDAPPRERSSDAVFAAVAAATWNALARAEGRRPDTFPARATRAARRLRR
jgi:aerobic-type carbon monoxide dehydrogenase small subunit (CoxS/CutS family)